eukprot:Skav208850  [mRNA]  locus=scaffold1839:83734:93744:- [translate_table: standard]
MLILKENALEGAGLLGVFGLAGLTGLAGLAAFAIHRFGAFQHLAVLPAEVLEVGLHFVQRFDHVTHLLI